MRVSFALVALLGVVGCNQQFDPGYDTPNRSDSSGLTYAKGPFGYTTGQIIQNLQFLGKSDPNGASGTLDYSTVGLTSFSLADYYQKPDTKLILLSGVAGWCIYCNEEQADIPSIQSQFESQGVKIVEGLVQGYSERTGAPATESDLNRWVADHSLHVTMALDPAGKLGEYADVSAFPLNMMIRTSDMQIVYMQVGYSQTLAAEVQRQLNAAQ